MRIQFVGFEAPESEINRYEVGCVRAKDVDLRKGTVVARYGETNLSGSGRQDDGGVLEASTAYKGMVVTTGSVHCHRTSQFGVPWGDQAYWLESSGNWRRVTDAGVSTALTVPSKPVVSAIDYALPEYDLKDPLSAWSPTAVSAGVYSTSYFQALWSGATHATNVEWKTFAVASPATTDLSDADALVFYRIAFDQFPDPTSTSVRLRLTNNGPVVQYCPLVGWTSYATFPNGSTAHSQEYLFPQFDISGVRRDNITEIAIEVLAQSGALTYNLFVAGPNGGGSKLWAWSGGQIENGIHVYTAVHYANGVPSLPADPKPFAAALYGNALKATVSNVVSGNEVRLFRAIGGDFYQAGSVSASASTSRVITDDGTPDSIGERIKQGGVLPFGPIVVWNNRVCVGEGTTLYIGMQGEPLYFSASAPIDAATDAYALIAPEKINALDVEGDALIVHCSTGRYRLTGRGYEDATFLRDGSGHLAVGHKGAHGGLTAAYDGIWLMGRRLMAKNDAWATTGRKALSANGYIFVKDGTSIYVAAPGTPGWMLWTHTAVVNDLAFNGTSWLIATENGAYSVATNATRKSDASWRSGTILLPSKGNQVWGAVRGKNPVRIEGRSANARHVWNPQNERTSAQFTVPDGMLEDELTLQVSCSGNEETYAIDIDVVGGALR